MRCHRPARGACSPSAHPLRTPAAPRREPTATVSVRPVPETLPAPSGPRIRRHRPGSGRRECRRAQLRSVADSPVSRTTRCLARFRHTRRAPDSSRRSLRPTRLESSRIRISTCSSVTPPVSVARQPARPGRWSSSTRLTGPGSRRAPTHERPPHPPVAVTRTRSRQPAHACRRGLRCRSSVATPHPGPVRSRPDPREPLLQPGEFQRE